MTGLTYRLAAIAITPPAIAEDHLALIDATRLRPSVLDETTADADVFENTVTLPRTGSALARGLDAGRKGGAAFDTGLIAPGRSRLVIIGSSGEVDVICDHHRLMRAQVVANRNGPRQ